MIFVLFCDNSIFEHNITISRFLLSSGASICELFNYSNLRSNLYYSLWVWLCWGKSRKSGNNFNIRWIGQRIKIFKKSLRNWNPIHYFVIHRSVTCQAPWRKVRKLWHFSGSVVSNWSATSTECKIKWPLGQCTQHTIIGYLIMIFVFSHQTNDLNMCV